MNTELQQRVTQLQAANEEVRASRQAAFNLMDDALTARRQTEKITANKKMSALYDRFYPTYQKLYFDLKERFAEIAGLIK